MLRISRFNQVCRYISISSVRTQNKELTKTTEREHAISGVEKKPQRLPLVKNFFLGKVDSDLMAYPEAIYENEQQVKVNQLRAAYKDFLETNIFENPDDVNNVRKLQEFGCFRSTSPLVTETMFSINEAESKYLSYSTFLSNHQHVMRSINEIGDATLKLKYIPKLESGELIGAPCLFESKRSDDIKKAFNTQAKFRDDTNKWILNGEKAFILLSPAHKDSLFLVVTSVESKDHVGDFKEGLMTFVVEGSQPGVNLLGVDETLGASEKAFNQVSVTFKDVEVDASNALGDDGMKMAGPLLSAIRLEKGVLALGGVMRPLLKQLVDHCIETKIQGVHMKDVETVKEQLGSLTSSCYALESMAYMTAGLIDIYSNQDVEVESAMVQSFAIQALTDFIVRPLHAVGPQAIVKGVGFERFIRDATQIAASGEPLDGIKQFIALSGIQHAGISLNEQVRKDRNPLNHPAFVFSRIFKQTSIDQPKKKLKLQHFLHPSLDAVSNSLEFSILRLNAAVEILLARCGMQIFEHSADLAKIADAATLCYAMFATASRASRSYCIGLRNADQEIQIANFFCYDGASKVLKIAKDIDNGEYGSGQYTFKMLGEKLIETKDYHLEHPTTRNF